METNTKFKACIYFSVLLVCLGGGFFPVTSFAQTKDLLETEQSFHHHVNTFFAESVYLHTDREAYLTGEILWFKAYVMSKDHKLSDISKVLYIELIDKDQHPVIQAKISLKQGIGNGSLFLPVSLASANYQLRAYTTLMQNSGPGAFFQKNICLINTQDDKQRIPIATDGGYKIDLYPEGGYLVDGIQSKIAIKTARNQHSVSFRGAVINQQNDTVANFKSLKNGIGTFTMTPSSSEKYRVVVVPDHEKPVLASFPVISERGYVMKLDKDSSGLIKIGVTGRGASSSPVFLIAHNQNTISFSGQKTLLNGHAEFLIKSDLLAEGVTRFSLFDDQSRPVAERLFFSSAGKQAKITATLNNSEYKTREKVALDISASDPGGRSLASDLSLSVFYLPSNLNLKPSDIRSYILLNSVLKGNIEDAGQYFSENNTQNEMLLDNLMLSSGWKGFEWQDILKKVNGHDSLNYLPDYEGGVISAKVYRVTDHKGEPGIPGFLSVPGKRVQLYTSTSDKNGILRFNTKDLYGPGELILQTSPVYKQNYKLQFLSPFSASFTHDSIPSLLVMDDRLLKGLRSAHLNMQVLNVFAADKLRQVKPALTDSGAFFGLPDKTYLLDNYTRFATTEEVIREYIPEIWLQRRSGHLELAVVNQQARALFNSEPLMMLDGVPFFDSSKILRYDPLKIRSIDIVGSRYFWGPLSFEGIVNFKTYQGNLDGYQLDTSDVVIDYEGLLEQRQFYMPEYHTPDQIDSPVPDFRNLLFWSGDIKTDSSAKQKKLEFYTSDQKGAYVGSIQGVVSDGSLVTEFFNITVK